MNFEKYLTEKVDKAALHQVMKSSRVNNAIDLIIGDMMDAGIIDNDKKSVFYQSKLAKIIYNTFK